MSASIGVNLRVTGHCRQGGRKYMEDFFCVAYQQTEDEKDLEYAFCGIYDGHGGAEAAAFAKQHLMEAIIKHKNFWSDNDEDVLRAIKDGYLATHYAMWKEQEKWPKTASGLPSTAGTTASIAFIRRGKIYIGHVGDSGIILGYQDPGSPQWKAMPLTRDHKPENADELLRIEQCGGKVVAKSGVPRVVWNRPRIGHQGPVRRSTPIDEIPFLAVARSLGDLWSYNSQINQFIVSPDPDCSVIQIDTNVHRCLIFGTDGLFNMLSPSVAVYLVQNAEIHNEYAALDDCTYKTWMNPSKLLVEKALQKWQATKMRADNTSVVTLMLDPPGPPKSQILKDRKKNSYPDRGLKIMTRYEDEREEEKCENSHTETAKNNSTLESVPSPTFMTNNELNEFNAKESNAENSSSCDNSSSVSSSDMSLNFPLKERNFVPKLRESTSFDPHETPGKPNIDSDKENLSNKTPPNRSEDNTIQINEISSSSNESENCDAVESSDSRFSNRHNLRSNKFKDKTPTVDLESTRARVKRKLMEKEDENEHPKQRKSTRIDQNQKKNAAGDEKKVNVVVPEELPSKKSSSSQSTKHKPAISTQLRKKRVKLVLKAKSRLTRSRQLLNGKKEIIEELKRKVEKSNKTINMNLNRGNKVKTLKKSRASPRLSKGEDNRRVLRSLSTPNNNNGSSSTGIKMKAPKLKKSFQTRRINLRKRN